MDYSRFLFLSLLVSSVSYAEPLCMPCHRIALQGSLATNGALGFGVASYSPTTEIGFTISGAFSNSGRVFYHKYFAPVIFGGFRKPIFDTTFFAYGLELGSVFGIAGDPHNRSPVFAGFYISLEEHLTPNLLLVGWINPYAFEYRKTYGSHRYTHQIFATGGIGFSYLF